MKGSINFFTENIKYKISRKNTLRLWIADAIRTEKRYPGSINIILCDDRFLLTLNRRYLKKSTLTDIITFSFVEEPNELSGDIYISLTRVKENAKKFKVLLFEELSRIIIHGILHLSGYDDQKEEERAEMRNREDFHLKRLRKLAQKTA
ncbi:MAG: rRNA maturation RNase YbeY [bacterium]